jgi:hypothetical protein
MLRRCLLIDFILPILTNNLPYASAITTIFLIQLIYAEHHHQGLVPSSPCPMHLGMPHGLGPSPMELCPQSHVRLLYFSINIDQFKCFNQYNNSVSLTSSNNSGPYILPLQDIHDNVQSSHVVVGGITNGDATWSAFVILIVANTTTQYVFTLTILQSSSF